MSAGDTGEAEYFYNIRTKMVEKGRLSSWEDLMGPYPTFAEAMNALATAEKRNAAWDDADEAWRDGSA